MDNQRHSTVFKEKESAEFKKKPPAKSSIGLAIPKTLQRRTMRPEFSDPDLLKAGMTTYATSPGSERSERSRSSVQSDESERYGTIFMHDMGIFFFFLVLHVANLVTRGEAI